jgi:hypothetical protein
LAVKSPWSYDRTANILFVSSSASPAESRRYTRVQKASATMKRMMMNFLRLSLAVRPNSGSSAGGPVRA